MMDSCVKLLIFKFLKMFFILLMIKIVIVNYFIYYEGLCFMYFVNVVLYNIW